MANNYILTENLDESFKFSIRDKVFEFHYPTTSEMKELLKKFDELKAETDTDKATKLSDQIDKEIHALITPVDHEESVDSLLEKESVVVNRRFSKMLREELFS